jgi:hypothetical protein
MSVFNTRSVDSFLSTDNLAVISSIPITAPAFNGPVIPTGNVTFPNDVTVLGTLNISGPTNSHVVNTFEYVDITSSSATIPALSVTSSGTADIFRAIDGDTGETFKVTNQGNIVTPGTGTFSGNVTASNITLTNASDISANTSAIATLQTSKQNTITTGTTSQYFRGDLSLATAGNLIGRSTVNNKTFYVSATGNDSNDGLSEFTCFLTLTAALTAAGSSGNQIIIFPGTYAGTFTISNSNLTIIGAQSEKGGLINLTGGLVITNSTSSVRIKGLSMQTLTHSGAGGAYFEDCYFNTSITLSGTGFTEFLNCDTQGGSFSTTTSITGAKQTAFVVNSKIGFTTINNASSFTTISNCANSLPLTLTTGTLGISNSPVFSISPTGNAISATGGSLILDDCFCLTPANLQARISIGAGVTYGIRKANFDFANSTISGTRVPQSIIMDSAQINTLTGTSLNLSSDCTINGNLTVNGTTITANSTVNTFDGYLQIDQNPASAQPALIVNQTGGSGSIVEVVDVDSNIKFKINQDCDLDINSGKFTVDSATGNTSSSGTLYSASTFTTDGQANLQNGAVVSGPLSATGAVTFSDTTAVKLPSGTTGQRPTAANGMIRYNTTTSGFEGYVSGAWGSIGGSGSGPTWTTETKSYPSFGLYQAPGQQISASTITGAPGVLQVMCMTENFLLMSDRATSSNIWLFINTAGTWSFAARYAVTYAANQAKCVGNQIVLLTTDSSSNYSCQEWLFSAGAISFVRTIASGNVNAGGLDMIANYVSFFDISNSTVRLYKFDGVSSWALVTNANFAAGFTPGSNDSTCLCSNPLQLITSRASTGTHATHRFYTITAGSPGSINTTPVQTISLTANTPAGFDTYGYSQAIVDLTNVSYSYLHLTAPLSACGGINVGGMLSYEYTGGSWTFRNSFTLGQANSDYAGWGPSSPVFFGKGLGMSVWNDTLSVITYTNKLLQFDLVKTAGAPYITCTLGSNFFPSGAQFSYNAGIVQAVTGNYLAIFSNDAASPEYIHIFGPRTSNSTTTVDYQDTVDNVEITGNLYCSGPFIRLPVTSAGTIQSLTPALMDGLFFIDSTTGVLRYLFNGSWQTLSFGSSTGGTIGGTGYVPNSGNLGLTGALINATQVNSGAVNSVGTTQVLMPNQQYDTMVVRYDGSLSGSCTILSQTKNLCTGGYSATWNKSGTGDYDITFAAISGHVSTLQKVVCGGTCIISGSSNGFINCAQTNTNVLQVGVQDTSANNMDNSGVLTCYLIRS